MSNPFPQRMLPGCRMPGLLAAIITLFCSHVSAQFRDTANPVVASTARFELRSHPRAAVFHFLLDWATADAGDWPPYAVPLREREGWDAALSPEERRVWTDALRVFGPAHGRSLLFDSAFVAVRDWAAGAIPRSAVPTSDQPLVDAVNSALPIYLAHWWPAHDARNRAWIAAAVPDLRQLETDVVRRLEAAYGGAWPPGRIPVDLVPYANPVGAYSVKGRVTISSRDRGNVMPQGLELLFHEASHTDSLELSLRRGLNAAFRTTGGKPEDRFWHDVIFFTTGELTRLAYERIGRPGYRHYGEGGVYTRGERWTVELPAFQTHWAPFLATGSSDPAARRAALEAVARAVLHHGPG